MAQQSTTSQAQKPTGRENLINAVDAFGNLLSPAERNALDQTETPGNILDLTTALKEAKVSEKKIKRCEAFLQSVQQFSSIVDTLIQHSPFISALVWGSVKILLLTARNYIQYFSCLTDLLEKLGVLCPIFKEFQDLWPHCQGLQDAVFDYYAQTVVFCTDALKFLRRSSTTMILRALVRPLNNELQDVEKKLLFQQKIVEYQVVLEREASARKARQVLLLFNSNWETYREEELQERIHSRQWRQRLEAGVKGIKEYQLQQWKKIRDLELESKTQKKFEERQRQLRRISDYNHTITFLEFANASHSCTGRWLFEMDEYKQWVQSNHSSLLWCYGIPGSGKSVLSTSIMKHLLDTCVQETQNDSGKTFIGYFFCTFSDYRSLKFEEIIRSLVKQVLSVFDGPSEFEEYLARFFEQCNNIPSTDLWKELFIRTCRIPNHIYLIIDGIDECPGSIQAQILELINQILSILRCIKVFLSSRKEIYLARNLRNAISISIDEVKQRPEIEGYIDASLKQRLDDGRLQVQDPAMANEIKEALMVGVEGMFLWVTLQIEDICRQLNDEEIRETLRSLPRNLDETYIRMLQRIVKEHKKDIAVEAFKWLTMARRRLSLRELAEAVVIRDDDTTQTQGLNQPVRDSSTLRFIHSTVVTFLYTYQLPIQLEVFRIEPQTTEIHLAKRCLQYLHFRDLQTQLEPAAIKSKPKRSVLSMPVSEWISPELRSNLIATASRRALEQRSREHVPKSANLRVFSPTSPKLSTGTDASQPQMQKSTLLDYVSKNWLHHCETLPASSQSSIDKGLHWRWFRDLILNESSWIELPWPSDSPSMAGGPHYECFKWAVQNSHQALVQLVFQEIASDGVSPTEYIQSFLTQASSGTKYEYEVSEMPLLVSAALGLIL
ncbi:hypothetical protein BDZ91DRAFT_848457 [Kalaharituber pfeilii]|nr:hypothetical protein BDZ91DRAFT_848457 [Kalaharituber pfeilii]